MSSRKLRFTRATGPFGHEPIRHWNTHRVGSRCYLPRPKVMGDRTCPDAGWVSRDRDLDRLECEMASVASHRKRKGNIRLFRLRTRAPDDAVAEAD